MNPADHPDPDAEAMGEAADRIYKVLRDHEMEAHGGQPCPSNRVGAVAYIAHRLGLKSKLHLSHVAAAMDDYDARCPCEESRRLETESN